MEKLGWFIVTGCYDSLARVWKAAGESTHILEGHSDVIASVGVINRKGVEGITVATASKDRTLRLWKFDTEDSINNPIRIRAFKILRGHTKSVQCVAAQNTGDMVCSGSWDSTIKLWQTNDSQSDGDLVSIKKRKGNDQADESQLEGEAVSTLVGHTQCVSSVVWPQQETIYSASWDHSVRLWDAETSKNSSDIFCTKVLNCLMLEVKVLLSLQLVVLIPFLGYGILINQELLLRSFSSRLTLPGFRLASGMTNLGFI
ncbi:hypothetical protein ACJW31_12G179800 [Castanea mollissima]